MNKFWRWLFKSQIVEINDKLNTLINSDRYKESDYEIQKINGKWGLKHKNSDGYYVDLVNNAYKWKYGGIYTRDCFGDLSAVLKAFNFRVPIVEPINIEKV